MATQPSGVSTTSLSFTLSVNLLKVHSVSPCKLLVKILNSIGFRIDTWGVPLMTGLQLDLVLLIHNPLSPTLWGQFSFLIVVDFRRRTCLIVAVSMNKDF